MHVPLEACFTAVERFSVLLPLRILFSPDLSFFLTCINRYRIVSIEE